MGILIMTNHQKILILLLHICLMSTLYISAATASSEPAATPLAPSDFQKNGNIIPILETGVQNVVKARESDELNYGLHLIGFGGISINDPKSQFITDYSRLSCNSSTVESNLPECANNAGIYAILSPSNIFNTLTYQQPSDVLISQTITRYLLNPFPSIQLNSLLQSKSSAADPKNQDQIASLIASQVPVMVAKNSLNGMIARRYVDPDTAQKLPQGATPASLMQLIHDESIRRVSDPKWFPNLNNLPVNQLLIELLQLEAFKLWMEYNKFEQNERIEALLATMVSSESQRASALSGMVDDKTKEQMKQSKSKMDEAQANAPDISSILPGAGG